MLYSVSGIAIQSLRQYTVSCQRKIWASCCRHENLLLNAFGVLDIPCCFRKTQYFFPHSNFSLAFLLISWPQFLLVVGLLLYGISFSMEQFYLLHYSHLIALSFFNNSYLDPFGKPHWIVFSASTSFNTSLAISILVLVGMKMSFRL